MSIRAIGYVLACVGLPLALASCAGDQPSTSSAPPAQSPVNAVPPGSTVPGLIGQWDQERYGEAFEQNRFADRQASLLRQEGGHVIFEPKGERDHVSTPFVPVTAGTAELELVLQSDSPEGDACTATLQDQSFRVLTTLPCAGGGEKKATAPVTADVTRVRVYFLGETLQPQQLPQRIQIIAAVKD